MKHHVLLTMSGCMVASAVTDGNRDDGSVLLKWTKTVPKGSGYLLADRNYCCKDNCKEVLRIDRLPCIGPPKSHSVHELSAGANMLRWERGKPGSFYKKYGTRHLVESDPLSLKGRLRSHIRSVTPACKCVSWR